MFKSFTSRRDSTLVVLEHSRGDVSRCHTAMKKLSPHASKHPQSLPTECLAIWTPWLARGLKGMKVKNFGGPIDSLTDWCESQRSQDCHCLMYSFRPLDLPLSPLRMYARTVTVPFRELRMHSTSSWDALTESAYDRRTPR